MGSLRKIISRLGDERGHFAALARHFFARFFDNDLLSPDGNTTPSIAQVLGIVAVPGLFICMFLLLKYGGLARAPLSVREAASLPDKCLFICISMVIMGFVTVFEWDALFPERRDWMILNPLPVRPRTIFAAKLTALFLFLALFAVDINIFSCVLFPAEAMGTTQTTFQAARLALAHAAAVLAASAFIFLLLVGVQALLMNLFSYRLFRRVSPYVQFFSMLGLLSLFFLFPSIAPLLPRMMEEHHPILLLYPPAWFLGLYQTLLGRSHPLFVWLAGLSLEALAIVTAASVVGYAVSYRRYARRSLETPESQPAGPSKIELLIHRLVDCCIVTKPLERATFYFVGTTMIRSGRHRLFLAAYAGVGFAFVLQGVVTAFLQRGWVGLDRPSAALLSIPLVLSFFILSGLRMIFSIPAELRANWIFRLAENERRRECLSGVRKAVLLLAILPLFFSLLPFYWLLWGWQTALLHFVFGLLLSSLLAEALLLNLYKIPFTCSHLPGQTNMALRVVVYWSAFTGYAYSMATLEVWLLQRPARFAVFCVIAMLALAGLAAWRNWLLKDPGFTLVFQEEMEPAVRTLDLKAFNPRLKAAAGQPDPWIPRISPIVVQSAKSA